MQKQQPTKETIVNETMLSQAFQAFNDTTTRFQEAYTKLEDRVAYLSKELAAKNQDLNLKISELEQTKKYLNNILESVSDGVIAMDIDGCIKTFNAAAQTITGFAPQEVIEKEYSVIFPEWKRERTTHSNSLKSISFPTGHETTIVSKTGELIPGIVYTSLITDEFSQATGIVVTFNDLSKIKQLENEIERAKRLAALGEMAAGVAHEIRNPLGGIEMYASLLERECSADARKKDIAKNITHGVRSLNKIITELLTFTRTFGKTDFQKINIIDCVESSLSFALHEFQNKAVTVTKRFDSDHAVLINGEIDQLRQVFLNLLLNAAQAINHAKGNLTVICYPNVRDGYVVVDIQDNGCGIAEDNLAKIFDPFFTTKSKGTGLGLAVSYRIIEAHGGKIRVQSIVDVGTTFSVFLPLIKE